MSAAELDTLALVAAVAAACAIPGTFLVLRRLSLVGDAISHVLLFGIVVAFAVVRDLDSPWLFAGAAAAGVLTVALVDLLQRSKLVKADAAIGLVFPALFSLGTLLASIEFRDIHLDVDSVLLGHAEFAARGREVYLGGAYLGRGPALVMLAVAAVNALLVAVFYKELKLSTFDPALAAALGFLPGMVHYGLMTTVSVSAVVAFDAVGPVLVVAFLVVPACTARLFADRLVWVLALSVGAGLLGSLLGVRMAYALGTNVAGSVATALGALFALAFVAAPRRGFVAAVLRRRRARREFLVTMLAVHLFQHENTPAEADESSLTELPRHLAWPAAKTATVARRAERAGVATQTGGRLTLTAAGRARAAGVLGG